MIEEPDRVDDRYRLDDCYEKCAGRIYLTGIQALVRIPMAQRRIDMRANLNTRGLVTGYRGSPLAGFDIALEKAKAHLEPYGIVTKPAINEELAATMIAGSQQAEADGMSDLDGVFGLWYGKGPGVDRAGDAIKHGHAYGSSKHGGVLVVAGDDHGAVSSTISHQSDQAFAAWSMPVLHPVGVEDYIKLGCYGVALSRFSGAWVGFKAIAETVESGRTIDLDEASLHFKNPDRFEMPHDGLNFRYNDPPSTRIEERLLIKLEAARAFAKANAIDETVVDRATAWLGIVTVGKAQQDLMAAFMQLGIDRDQIGDLGIRILNIKQTFPIEPEGAARFAEGLKSMLVVEEKRPLVEDQLKSLLYGKAGSWPQIIGKRDRDMQPLLPEHGELRPHVIAKVLADLIGEVRPELQLELMLWRNRDLVKPAQINRTPHFCSGCPHNTSTKLPDDAVAFGGIGCHVMATWMDRGTRGITQMGGEGSNWTGLAPFTRRSHAFQNLGDGTYFHSGLLSIRQAVSVNTPITFKILFNDAVAMTGGQAIDGTLTVDRMAHQLVHEGVERIVIVSDEPDKHRGSSLLPPGIAVHHRDELIEVQRELATYSDVSVMIYDQTCAAEKRRRRKRGLYPDPAKRAYINSQVCEGCGDCSTQSNCLSIQTKKTAFGTKRMIDQSSCNKDFSCVDGFCPSFVTIEGGRLRTSAKRDRTVQLLQLANTLSDPNHHFEKNREILVTGIGGTGVLTIGAVIAMAAHLQGYQASVLDFAGLAQKGGAVLSHIRLSRRGPLLQARIEPGDADAMIACDLVVASSQDARTALRPGGARIMANGRVVPTSDLIRDPNFSADQTEMAAQLEERAGLGSVSMIDSVKIAEQLFDDAIFANMVLAGSAFEAGLIPLELDALLRAIDLNGVAVETNREAFAVGRLAVADPNAFADIIEPLPSVPSLDEQIDKRVDFLTQYQDTAYAARYKQIINKVRAHEIAVVGKAPLRVTEAVVQNLFKLMAIKDEFEVARLFSNGEFEAELRQRFEGNYKVRFHLAPPAILPWLGRSKVQKKIEFGGWMMPLMRALASIRAVRGTWMDPFSYLAERMRERALLSEYETTILQLVTGLSLSNEADLSANLNRLRKLAQLPDMIRGFGHIKEAAVERYQTERAALISDIPMLNGKNSLVERARKNPITEEFVAANDDPRLP